ncbi:unnamed protein product [Trifolium pratense]|uniref:Uncharacterized protein n=1 Tax=Trifolium pratense TaxID=57577 RepID=A0ACB0J278_TRIPR|nr:unnamed protein product [Trifolium pratense]
MKRGKCHKLNHIEDRLSDLPDCILLHIMSFLNTKRAVQTSILSTRWRNVWKYLPKLTLNLTLASSHFNTVSRIFSLRDDSTALDTLNFSPSGLMEPRLLERVIEYIVSHNIKLLRMDVICDIEHFKPCLFSCQTLTYLNLIVIRPHLHALTLFPNSLTLPALTTLSLQYFAFSVGNDGRVEPFSALNKLNSLIINRCKVLDAQNLCISNTTLVHLKIIAPDSPPKASCKIELSTPSLSNFYFRGTPIQKLCGSNGNLSSIKHVTIYVVSISAKTPLVLLNWLVELANIESLTVSPGTLKVLSFVPDLLEIEFPSLCHLKSLNVKSGLPLCFIPEFPSLVDFLRQNSPSVKINGI